MPDYQEDIPKAYEHKPDPDEPWRYETPCCGKQPKGERSTWRCRGCGDSYQKDELVDKKS